MVTSDHQQGHENMGEFTLETKGQEYGQADGFVLVPALAHLAASLPVVWVSTPTLRLEAYHGRGLHLGLSSRSLYTHPRVGIVTRVACHHRCRWSTPRAIVMELEYPSTGRGSDTGSLSPPLPLEPWSAGSPTEDRRWGVGDQEYATSLHFLVWEVFHGTHPRLNFPSRPIALETTTMG